MTQERWHKRLFWLFIAALITVIITAFLSPYAGEIRDRLFKGNPPALGTPLVHVGLNPSACTGPFTGTDSGMVNVHFNSTGNSLDISIHDALPNTTYVVDIRCVGAIGFLTMSSEGSSIASLNLPSTLPVTFYIDVEIPPPNGTGYGGYGDTFIAGPFSK